jgi:signal transduction histidine kinase
MINKILTYLLFFTVSVSAFGQNNRVIDSLKLAKTNSSQVDRATILNQLGWEYRLKNPDSTIFYCNQAIVIAEDIGNPFVLGTSLNFLGIAYGYKGEYSSAFKSFNNSLDNSIAFKDTVNLAHAQNSLGRLLFSQGDMINSYQYFFSALNIFESIGDKAGMGYCYKSLSELYLAQNNLEKALIISIKALEIRQTLENIRGQISSYQDIADIHLQQKRYEEGLEYLDIAQNLAQKSNDNISLVETYLGMSDIFYHQNQLNEALEFGLKSLDPYVKLRNQSLLNRVHLQLGKVYYSLNNLPKAEEFLTKLIGLEPKSGELAIIKDANFFLSRIYEAKSNDKLALYYLKRYNTVNDSLNNIDIARTIERMEIRLDLQEIEKENKLLKIQKVIDDSEIDKQKTRNLALTATTTLVIFIIFFVIRYTRQKIKHSHKLATKNDHIESQNKKINEQNNGLEKRNQELAELNREKDNLMNIVAHDLRSPFNNLKGIGELILLSGTLNKEQKEYVTLLKDVATKGSHLTRDILDVNAFETNDEPYVISNINIYDFIVQKFNEFMDSGQQKNITLKIKPIDPKISFLTEKSHLSRIIDNLLSNAIKYSEENTEVEIHAYQENNLSHFSIKDYGPGFSEDDKKNLYKKFKKLSARPTGGETSNGLGLAIVKTLTERLQGSITLNTSEDGSEFIISLPDID